MNTQKSFGSPELGLVCGALTLAEECVSDYYRISDDFWHRHPYDFRTLAELQPGEISDQALAQVVKVSRPPMGGGLRTRELFRVCLQDHNLLEIIRREGDGKLLNPLLLYVLAHELVHVVRFYKFLHLFEATPEQIKEEENRVHRQTAQILSKVPLAGVDEVINLYESCMSAQLAVC